ncbi:MAG TPA: tRNA lysidine(34) synthetase TilS [Gemmatimonadaceae bacterium]|jgi:tRNA(Ile)-lysidine synthase|nr:tRNA lysidine(34) synthetase TilS [Gemmatimonadaceae bacterium]
MVNEAVAKALAGKPRVVLAVSGGTDSMALLEAAAHTARARISAVATFDHGTGEAARVAAALVADRTLALGLKIVTGQSGQPGSTEADWRAARWAFLRGVAREARATIVTAHTRDDQVETVVMRIMRAAGARGLAGLYADSDVLRPFVDVPRSAIATYIRERNISVIDDPSNASLRHLRNRVRLDLLPALRRVRPKVDEEILAIARRAAEWRREVERLVKGFCPVDHMGDHFAVAVADLAGYDAASLAIIWPAIAARAGVTLDWRGTSRVVAFTTGGRVGSSIQLSGGVEVVRTRAQFVIRP